MSLQFILGNSGSGKSHYLYQQIVNESMEHPEKNYLVLVPEQFTMQTQRDLCAAHPRGGIMNIDALSFMRLAYRVFEEVGREEQPVLDDEGKNLVIRRIAGKLEDDLKVLKGNLRQSDYMGNLKDGGLYVLLANTNREEAGIVVQRFAEKGYKSQIVERVEL